MRRNQARTPSIHTRQWRALRARVIREEPTCWLQLDGCTTISDSVDHIIPRSIRPDLTMVRSNLHGACRTCNYRRGSKPIAQLHKPKSQQSPGDAKAMAWFNTKPAPKPDEAAEPEDDGPLYIGG